MFSMGQSYDNIQANVPLVAHNRLRWQLCPKFSFSPSQYFIWDPNTKKSSAVVQRLLQCNFALAITSKGVRLWKIGSLEMVMCWDKKNISRWNIFMERILNRIWLCVLPYTTMTQYSDDKNIFVSLILMYVSFFYKPPKKLQTIKLLITSCPPLPISLTKGPSDHLAWPIGFVSLSKAEISFVKVLLRSNSDKSSRVKFNSYEQRPLSKTFTTTLWKTSKYLREVLFHLISTHRRGTDTRYKTEKFRNGLR